MSDERHSTISNVNHTSKRPSKTRSVRSLRRLATIKTMKKWTQSRVLEMDSLLTTRRILSHVEKAQDEDEDATKKPKG